MSGLAAADRIQSTEECLTQEERHVSEAVGLNTNPPERLLIRELLDAVRRRANKYRFYESDKSPLDTAVQACNVTLMDIFLDCVVLDEQVKTRMVSNAYTNFFHCEFNQITKDHIAMVKRLLELGADVNGGPSVFPVSVATTAGSYPLVELLCQHGADLNKKGRILVMSSYPPLCIAAKHGHYDMIELLLKFGANVNVEVLSATPVSLALLFSRIDCAELLLQHGANCDVHGALYSLKSSQSVACMNFLLTYFRQETQQCICKHQKDFLMLAVTFKDTEFLSHFLDIVFDITGESPCWEELLVRSQNGEIASFLIQKGADVNKLVETRGSYTPLYLVLGTDTMCYTHKLQIVKVLLENGASLNIRGDISPLMIAALTNNSSDLLQLLLDYGADINWRDKKGDTAFSYSVYQDCNSNAEFLIRCVKDKNFFNLRSNEGLTALMQAARYSNVAVVKEVINHNPDMNMTDNNGNTALLHALNRIDDFPSPSVYAILTNAGCDVNLQNDDGLSPLMLAASRNSKVAIQILLDAGADINAVSKRDSTKTALSYFQPMDTDNEYITACLEIFLAHGACLSYLQPKVFHRILLCNDSDTICKLITSGTGPVTVRSDEYFNYFTPADPTFDVSPLCTALLSGNASLARHFVDIMWLTKSDLTSLAHNKPVRSYLEKENHTQSLNLLDEMSSQPVSLFRLAFTEVSSAVGISPGYENLVNKLPRLLKDKLLFKSTVDFLTPTLDTIPFRLLPSDCSPYLYIDVLDRCKCCRVWQHLKLEHSFRKYLEPCLNCMEHNCSECFLEVIRHSKNM